MRSVVTMSMHRASRYVVAFAVVAVGLPSYAVVINEIRIGQPGTDNQDYFELAGDPGESLDGLYYLVLNESNSGRGRGELEQGFELRGNPIPFDQYYLAANGAIFFNSTPPFLSGSIDGDFRTGGPMLDDGHNVTHIIVSGFSCNGVNCRIGSDLDTNDDGVLDFTPWTSVLDSVSIVVDPSAQLGSPYYGPAVLPNGSSPLAHIYRFPNKTGPWQVGNYDGVSNGYLDTPGFPNRFVPEPSTANLVALGLVVMSAFSRYFSRCSRSLGSNIAER